MDPLSPDDVFGPDGALVARGFEHRPGQLQMAQAVARTLTEGGVLLAEAGTGTGKTLAYLVPALAMGRRVVVSTATKNLQGQIKAKDAPLLAALLGVPVSVAVLKGRRNYLCKHRLAQADADPPEGRTWQRVRAWASTTQTGDRAEVAGVPEGAPLWEQLTVGAESCLGSKCPQFEACFVTKARARAAVAEVVVVNHHLYFGDLAVREAGGQVLPDHDAVVFDEAHAVPDVAAQFFGRSVSSAGIDRWIGDAGRAFAGQGAAPVEVVGALATVHRAAEGLFRALRPAEGRQAFDPATAPADLTPRHLALDDALAEAALALLPWTAQGEAIPRLIQRANALRDDLAAFFDGEDTAQVRFVEARKDGAQLAAWPIEPADRLGELIEGRLHAAVFTSATLTVGGDFDYARRRLGLLSATEAVFESPFDYPDQARLFLPDDLPAPDDPRFPDAVAWYVRELCALTEGRAFVLFTSHRNLDAVHRRLLRNFEWPLLRQGDAPRDRLMEAFRGTPHAVLLGTASFWEGVDVAGDALSLVIIDKIPFGSPGDPVLAARIDAAKAAGEQPFRTLQLPAAALTLKQGFGRLIRTATDRGIVAVMDRRLTRSGYGKLLQRALPPAPVVTRLAEIQGWWGPRPGQARLPL
ncbi:MAG: ATP-dependent DNA helicase [Myxococcales bacterium]|nr:ATP-dependent DNA helicase [Myxococcales bacterium]